MVAGEHLPDRFGQGSGELDLGDFGAALAAHALLGGLVALAVERVSGSVGGGDDQRPAQVFGAVVGQRPAAVAVAGLVDTGAQPAVAAQPWWVMRSG